MAARRAPLILGLTLAGAGGYYLYTAGGDPKVAQKKIERESAIPQRLSLSFSLGRCVVGNTRAGRLIESSLVYPDDAHAVSPFSTKGKEVQKSTEEFAAKAGSKLDQIVSLKTNPSNTILFIPIHLAFCPLPLYSHHEWKPHDALSHELLPLLPHPHPFHKTIIQPKPPPN